MNLFRENTPCRSKNIKIRSSYRDYKKELQKDFNKRCGYCDDNDIWKNADYHIDHFVPKKHLKTITENDYSNLVYSCFYCNNAKSSDWPTHNEIIHNNGRIGYLDPCNPEYDQQFYRDQTGQIIPKTELGKYMHRKLKLYLRRHCLIWFINRLSKEIDEMKSFRIQSEKVNVLYDEYKKINEELHIS